MSSESKEKERRRIKALIEESERSTKASAEALARYREKQALKPKIQISQNTAFGLQSAIHTVRKQKDDVKHELSTVNRNNNTSTSTTRPVLQPVTSTPTISKTVSSREVAPTTTTSSISYRADNVNSSSSNDSSRFRIRKVDDKEHVVELQRNTNKDENLHIVSTEKRLTDNGELKGVIHMMEMSVDGALGELKTQGMSIQDQEESDRFDLRLGAVQKVVEMKKSNDKLTTELEILKEDHKAKRGNRRMIWKTVAGVIIIASTTGVYVGYRTTTDLVDTMKNSNQASVTMNTLVDVGVGVGGALVLGAGAGGALAAVPAVAGIAGVTFVFRNAITRLSNPTNPPQPTSNARNSNWFSSLSFYSEPEPPKELKLYERILQTTYKWLSLSEPEAPKVDGMWSRAYLALAAPSDAEKKGPNGKYDQDADIHEDDDIEELYADINDEDYQEMRELLRLTDARNNRLMNDLCLVLDEYITISNQLAIRRQRVPSIDSIMLEMGI